MTAMKDSPSAAQLVIRQKKRGDKVDFTFGATSLDYLLVDSGGTEVKLSVAYDQLPSPFYYKIWTPRSHALRFVLFIMLFICLSRLVRTPEMAAQILVFFAVAAVVLSSLTFLLIPIFQRAYVRVPVAGYGNLLVLNDGKKDLVLAELERRRKDMLRQRLAVVDGNRDPFEELARLRWLRDEDVITAAEYESMRKLLGVEEPAVPAQTAVATPPLLLRQWQLGQKSRFVFHADHLAYEGGEDAFKVHYGQIAAPEDYKRMREASWLANTPFFLTLCVLILLLALNRDNHNWVGAEGLNRLLFSLAWAVPLLLVAYYGGQRLFKYGYVLVPTMLGDITVLGTSKQDEILREIEARRQGSFEHEQHDEPTEVALSQQASMAQHYVRELFEMGVITPDEHEELIKRITDGADSLVENAQANRRSLH